MDGDLMPKRIALTVIALAGMLGVGYGAGRTTTLLGGPTQTKRPQVQLPAGPASWVAFEADVTVTDLGQGTLFQRFYRASDGSTRTEAYSPDKTQVVITIHNAQTRRVYVKGPSGGWASMADVQPPLVTQPAFRTDWVGTTPESVAGLEAYRLAKTGSTAWLARDLNYFEIRTEYPQAGKLREYQNIERREPSRDLFLPPAGEDVRDVSQVSELLRRDGGK